LSGYLAAVAVLVIEEE